MISIAENISDLAPNVALNTLICFSPSLSNTVLPCFTGLYTFIIAFFIAITALSRFEVDLETAIGFDTLDIIVIGDIDGDGKCMSADYRSVNRHILKQSTLEGCQYLAADNDENGKIQSADYRKMNRYILKQIDSLLN